jgi:ParB family transcriptional regulator, chromosome partitioning protein
MAAGRKVSLAGLASKPVESVPGHSAPVLTRLPLGDVAPTPLNPREHFGADEELTELGESMRVRQLQPVVVVGREAYLRLWPEHEGVIGQAKCVLVNGERRYRAAAHVALDGLDALVREEIADSRAGFMDALLSENIDRKNFDPIEEANAVEAMVAECGTARAAAERFRRHETWVSQRRTLLQLTPAMQTRVRNGEIPVRSARSLALLPGPEQEPAWQKQLAEQAGIPRERKRARPQKIGAEQAEHNQEEQADGLPPAPSLPPAVAAMPWHQPQLLAAIIRERMSPAAIARLIDCLETITGTSPNEARSALPR